MKPNSRTVWARVIFTFLMTGMLGLSLMPLASAGDRGDIEKAQQTLRDKGYYTAPVEGSLSAQIRAAIRQYQQSANLPVTGPLDSETAGKPGVGPESEGSDYRGAGQAIGAGGKGVGHEIKQGELIAAGKGMGEGLGEGGKDAGKEVGEGGKDAGKGVGEGGKDAGKGVGKGGKDAGKGVGKGGKDVGKGIKKVL